MPTAVPGDLSAETTSVFDRIDRDFDASLEEIRAFLRQPGFSHTGEGIAASAEMARQHIASIGDTDTELVATDGNPVVFGTSRSRRPDAPTLIIYSLYDVVPVTAQDWAVPPLAAEIIDPTLIGEPAEVGPLLCARGAMNQRGPMMAVILALRAMKAVTGDIPVNVVWAWEGEEEIGSPHIGQFVRARHDALDQAQGVWVPGMRQDRTGLMKVTRGARGKCDIELRIKGGAWGGSESGKDIWSAYMPLADAPMLRMLRVLESLLDADDHMTLDGAAELLEPADADQRAELDTLRQRLDFETLRKTIGISRYKNGQDGADLLEDYLMKPLLNVVGITGGYTGPGVYTTLPMDVTAKLDVKVPPRLRAADVCDLLRKHLDRRGFTEVEIIQGGTYEYVHSRADDPLFQAGYRACATHDCDYLVWPFRPGGVPTGWFNQPPLSKPVSDFGLGYGGRWHEANEFVTVEGLRELMKYTVSYLTELASPAAAPVAH